MSKDDKSKGNKRSDAASARVTWELIERALACDLLGRIYLFGPPGVGKTYAAYAYGRTEREVYACTLTQETPAAELRGTYLPKGDTLAWHDGPVVRAMKEGARLVLNELSHASDDALAFLYPVLEHVETARITLPTGETVRPAQGFHVVVTDNLAPDGLPPALRDRFDSLLEISEPHPSALARLSEPLREAARRSFALGDDRRVSVRSWLTLDRVRHMLGLEAACLAVFGAQRGSQIFDALVLAGVR
jgi:nitric oxide reductase NorQ protein